MNVDIARPTLTRVDDGSIGDPIEDLLYVGAGATRVTLRGQNFQAPDRNGRGCRVLLRGKPLTMAYHDAQTINVVLPAATFELPNDGVLQVENFGGNSQPKGSNKFSIHTVYPAAVIATTAVMPRPIDPPGVVKGQKQTLTIHGAYFYPKSRVTFNGTQASVRYVNSSSLQVDLPADVANTPGLYSVVVINPSSRKFNPPASNGATQDGGPSNPSPFRVDALHLQAQLQLQAPQLNRINSSKVSMTVQLANIGDADAGHVKITSATLAGVNGKGLPINVGTIGVGTSQNVALKFSGPLPGSGKTAMLQVSGAYDGGTFTATRQVTLP